MSGTSESHKALAEALASRTKELEAAHEELRVSRANLEKLLSEVLETAQAMTMACNESNRLVQILVGEQEDA